MTNRSKIWMDGKLVNWEDANVHILTHGLHYGGGVFEGIRIYNTAKGKAIFRLRDHMVRFYNSAKVIWLEIPYSMDELCDASRLVVRNSVQEADYLRPLAYYGASTQSKIGLNPKTCPTRVAIAATHMGAYMGQEQIESGASIITSTWEKPSNRAAMLNAKICGNYINSVVAKLEAIHRGFDEALMLNANGEVAEGTGENLFMVKRNVIYTPPLSAGILEGITRDSVFTIASNLGYDVIERSMTRSELYLADEVFMTGTAAELTPISRIDDISIGSGKAGPITKELQKAFTAAANGKDPKYEDWLDYVE